MKLRGKNILLISPEPWDHIFVSKHHYATHLAQNDNKVYFLNPPSNKKACILTSYENLYSVNYVGFIKGLRFLPRFIQRIFFKKKFNNLQKVCGTEFDFIWSFDNSVFFDFSALPKGIYSISHIVDLNQDFEFEKASRTANLCLCTTKYILEKQKRYNVKSYNIGHGFNKTEASEESFILINRNKVNCGYAGNLDIQYIDWDIVDNLVNEFPNINFHFAGNWKLKENFSHFIEKPNFRYYGKLKANQLPSFYFEMDILLLVYQYEKYPEQLANPHKMVEYLASGKMVAATWTEEYHQLKSNQLIMMSESKEEFFRNFEMVVTNLAFWNSPRKQEKRISFSLNNSYHKKIEIIEKLITQS